MSSRGILLTSTVLALAWVGVAEAGGHCRGTMGGGMMGGGRGPGMMGGGGCCMRGGMQIGLQSQQAALLMTLQQQNAMRMVLQQQQNTLRAMQQNARQQNTFRAVPQKQQTAIRAAPQQGQQKVQPKQEPKAVQAADDAAATEQTAVNALKFVRTLLDVGKTDKAIQKLHELIKKYPDTAAAQSAKELLLKIDT